MGSQAFRSGLDWAGLGWSSQEPQSSGSLAFSPFSVHPQSGRVLSTKRGQVA